MPTRFLINQCQIITVLILISDIIENSRIELRGIVLPVQVGGLLGGGGGGGGGAKGYVGPPSQIIGGGLAPPPPPPPSSTLCAPGRIICCRCVSTVNSFGHVGTVTLFLGRLRLPKRLTSTSCTYFSQQLRTAFLESAEGETKVLDRAGYRTRDLWLLMPT